MNINNTNKPINLSSFTVRDSFWTREMELIRKEVIPYQWDALNDAVPGAEPSYCISINHNISIN